mmetsp:Transcript_9011/g.9533  ORF Transcript_9011/g.9533 Transcript_9011/m.9533 type:complete len:155 (+) Transcript_9011:57-521(+)
MAMISSISRISRRPLVQISKTSIRSLSTYSEKQEKTGRPLSPHVTIYAFPTVAISSIAVRGTGIGLAFGFYGAGIASLLGLDVAELMSTIGATQLGPAVKFTVAFPFVYHYLGGVRHFIWDYFPENTVDNKTAESSSYLLFGLTAAACAGAAIL